MCCFEFKTGIKSLVMNIDENGNINMDPKFQMEQIDLLCAICLGQLSKSSVLY